MPDNRKDKRGGYKQGGGRPKGAKNINSMASVKRLQELGFDPIEMMVKKYTEIQKKLDKLDAEGKGGSGAYAQMTATQGNLINNLMAYGYKKVPDKIEQEITNKKPVAIKLTTTDKED